MTTMMLADAADERLITPRTADGRYLFGSVDRDRMGRALLNLWCGVCGRPLEHRAVLMMRLSDLPRQCTSEPALHRWCAAYTSEPCPVIGGRLEHYRSSLPRLDTNMLPAPDASARQGAAAELWFAVWLADYRVVIDHGNLAASCAGTQLKGEGCIADAPRANEFRDRPDSQGMYPIMIDDHAPHNLLALMAGAEPD
ncbi:hypothetical protein ACWEKJ_10670 [Amycolatopsis thermoflava]